VAYNRILGEIAMIPLVSVVIPLYNYEKYIAGCVQSVLNQDYPNFEIIIVDDCSTDNSYKIAKKFSSHNVFTKKLGKNRGYSKVKNAGIVRSKGKYITILDADDMYTIDSISSRMEVLLKSDADFIHADAIAIYGDKTLGQCYKIKDPKMLHFPTPYEIHAQTVIVKRDLYKKFGLYDEKLRSRSDREMWWRFFGKSKDDDIKIAKEYIAHPVAYYRYHDKSMTMMRQRDRKYDRKVRKLAEKVYEDRKDNGITKDNTVFLED
jgi:glycosyltransferase involved in cell wall biosynthesis